MVKHTSIGHLKCWLLWAVDDKIISILAVIGHKVIFWTRTRDSMAPAASLKIQADGG